MSFTAVTNPIYLQAITKRPHKVYMYVPNEMLPSIRQHGYLSVCAQKRLLGALPQEIISKYAGQMDEAVLKYPDLAALLKRKSIDDQVLAYLDWRMEEDISPDLRGSCAIYVLYYPIPGEPEIVDYVTNIRQFATADRVLLSTWTDAVLYPIPFNTRISEREYASRDYWVARWHEQMSISAEKPLWLQGIPHACFFPANGVVPFNQLKIEDSLFA